MSARKFYRLRVVMDVLSEDPLADHLYLDTRWVLDQCDSGDLVLHSTHWTGKEVDGPEMARLLEESGSDPEFFGLTADGEDVEK